MQNRIQDHRYYGPTLPLGFARVLIIWRNTAIYISVPAYSLYLLYSPEVRHSYLVRPGWESWCKGGTRIWNENICGKGDDSGVGHGEEQRIQDAGSQGWREKYKEARVNSDSEVEAQQAGGGRW
jgi:hypothetical protein